MFRSFIVAAAVLVVATPVMAQTDPAANALKTCVADNTSGKDRKDLAKWIFLAMAAHPEMRPLAGADVATAADESSRAMAALVTRLLTVSCANETRAVMKTDAARSFVLAFEGLGVLAMQELMNDKSVKDAMGVFERYLDQKRFAEAIAGK